MLIFLQSTIDGSVALNLLFEIYLSFRDIEESMGNRSVKVEWSTLTVFIATCVTKPILNLIVK